MTTKYTSGQLYDAIISALQDGEVRAVPGLIRMLAVVDPHAAQEVLDTLELGLRIRDLDVDLPLPGETT